LICDVHGEPPGPFRSPIKLTINGVNKLNDRRGFCEYDLDRGRWVAFNQNGYVYSAERPAAARSWSKSSTTAAPGPYVYAIKHSTSPAANDYLGGVCAGAAITALANMISYVLIDGQILDPTDRLGGRRLHRKVASSTAPMSRCISRATGGDKGPGSRGVILNGAQLSPISARFPARPLPPERDHGDGDADPARY
jgi:hypothetical protein